MAERFKGDRREGEKIQRQADRREKGESDTRKSGKERISGALKAIEKTRETATDTKPLDTNFNEANLKTVKGLRGEMAKFSMQSQALRGEEKALEQKAKEAQAIQEQFDKGKKEWGVFLRGSPLAEDQETVALEHQLAALKNKLFDSKHRLAAQQNRLKVYGEKIVASAETFGKSKKEKGIDIEAKSFVGLNLRQNQEALNNIDQQNELVSAIAVERPNLWEATGGLLFSKSSEGLGLVSSLIKGKSKKDSVFDVARSVVANVVIDLPAGVIEGVGEMASGLVILASHPIDAAKGMAALAGRDPSSGQWSKEVAGGAWKEMGKVMVAVENFKKGEIGKGVGKAAVNILTTLTGAAAAGKAGKAAQLAYRAARVESGVTKAALKATGTGTKMFAREFASGVVKIPGNVLKTTGQVLKAPVTISRKAAAKFGSVKAIGREIGEVSGELSKASKRVEEMAVAGKKVQDIPELAGKSFDELSKLSGDELVKAGITDTRSIRDFLEFRDAVSKIENLEGSIAALNEKLQKAEQRNRPILLKNASTGKIMAVPRSEAGFIGEASPYQIGQEVKIPRSDGRVTRGVIESYDTATGEYKVTWEEGGSRASKKLDQRHLDDVNLMKETDRYGVGETINIPRSDGRITQAKITVHDHRTGAFTVRWQENGSVKLKEVTVDQLDSVNPAKRTGAGESIRKAEIAIATEKVPDLEQYPIGEEVNIPRSSGKITRGRITEFQDGYFKVEWEEGGKRASKMIKRKDLDGVNAPRAKPLESTPRHAERLKEARDWKEVKREKEVMAVGDLHGNLDGYRENLRSLGAIDANNNWIGGDRKIVFHGDILADRGTDSLNILLEIRRLREQARKAGGEISVIAGNHEDFAISFLMEKKAAGADPVQISMMAGQGLGLTEFKQFGSEVLKNMADDDFGIWPALQKERQTILEAMRRDPKGRAILEEICSMKIADRVDDSLFIHTNPTEDMMRSITERGGIDEINRLYQEGLRNVLLEGKPAPSEFNTISDLFLATNNRENFADVALASRIKAQGINQIFYGHTDDFAATGKSRFDVGDVSLVSVDRSAFKGGKKTNERSVALVGKDGGISLGINKEAVREGVKVAEKAPEIPARSINISREHRANEIIDGMDLRTKAEHLSREQYFSNRFRKLAEDPRQPSIVRQILQDNMFEAATYRTVDGMTFYIGSIIQVPGESRLTSIVFVEKGGVLEPRYFYKSHSDGVWRGSPFIEASGRKSKGKFHYTQETRPIDEINDVLSQLETETPLQKPINPDTYFKVADWEGEKAIYEQYGAEVKVHRSPGLEDATKCPPGSPRQAKLPPYEARHYFENMKYPEGFIPDFTEMPLRNYEIDHSMLGKCGVKVYEGKLDGRTVEWHMAADQSGRVWVQSIRFSDSKANSFGMYSEVIDSGILTTKPVEYSMQAYGVAGQDFVELPASVSAKSTTRYVDQTPLIDAFLPIKRFREATGIAFLEVSDLLQAR